MTQTYFRVHSSTDAAGYLGRYLEEAIPASGASWEIADSVDVLVRGDSDQPNGFLCFPPPAHGQRRDLIVFLQLANTTIDSPLAFHELIIHCQHTTRGLSRPPLFFGSSAKVNYYQPAWLTEGLPFDGDLALANEGRGVSLHATDFSCSGSRLYGITWNV